MTILDLVEKGYPSINDAASDFLTKLTGTGITKDIALSAEMAGLMLLRASSTDLSKMPAGEGIIGAIADDAFNNLITFVRNFALSNGLSPTGFDAASIPSDVRNYFPELTQFETPFYEVCKKHRIENRLLPYTAAASAGKLVLAGHQLGILDAKIGLAVLLFHIFAGGKTVPYPAI